MAASIPLSSPCIPQSWRGGRRLLRAGCVSSLVECLPCHHGNEASIPPQPQRASRQGHRTAGEGNTCVVSPVTRKVFCTRPLMDLWAAESLWEGGMEMPGPTESSWHTDSCTGLLVQNINILRYVICLIICMELVYWQYLNLRLTFFDHSSYFRVTASGSGNAYVKHK